MGPTQRELCPDASGELRSEASRELCVNASRELCVNASRELCLNAPGGLRSYALDPAGEHPESAPDFRWFAVSVKHQHERSVEGALAYQNFEALAPLYRVHNRWSDRVKQLDLPLFAGYVFCRFPYRDKVRVLNTPGVRQIVGFGAAPAPVDDAEIACIQAMQRSGVPVRPWPFLKPGDRVRVERGPLRGLTGTLIREKDTCRLVIGVDLLQRSIAAELDPSMIVPLRAATA
jgi:transcription antitermination factor NusG